ncbi:hypothetical protein SMICM304S_00053 [Streptomyces microflavus]
MLGSRLIPAVIASVSACGGLGDLVVGVEVAETGHLRTRAKTLALSANASVSAAVSQRASGSCRRGGAARLPVRAVSAARVVARGG